MSRAIDWIPCFGDDSNSSSTVTTTKKASARSLTKVVLLSLAFTVVVPFLLLCYALHIDSRHHYQQSIDEINELSHTLSALKHNLSSLNLQTNKTSELHAKVLKTKREIVAVSFKISELNHKNRMEHGVTHSTSSTNKRHHKSSRPLRSTVKKVDPLKMAMLEMSRMQIDDAHLNNLTYYQFHATTNVSHTSLSTRDIEKMATANVASKGLYVIAHVGVDGSLREKQVLGLDKEPFHSYYRYAHNYTDPCLLHYISLNYDPNCGDSLASRYIRPLLIVSVQRSGSHYAWEMLNRLGIHVHHEGLGPDGAVSWLYAVNSISLRVRAPPRAGRPLRGMKYVSSKSKKPVEQDVIIPATGQWKGSPTYGTVGIFVRTGYAINNPEKMSQHRFRVILHQVRHPIRVINTLVKRCASWDKFWRWIAYVKGMKAITKNQSPLRRAMLLYILWNKHIERYADIRFKSETTSPKTICLLGNLKDRCNGSNKTDVEIIEPAPEPEEFDQEEQEELQEEGEELEIEDLEGPIASASITRYSNNTQPNLLHAMNVTWADVEKEDKQLANELKIMCIEYGYDLDPDMIPQNEETKQFTA